VYGETVKCLSIEMSTGGAVKRGKSTEGDGAQRTRTKYNRTTGSLNGGGGDREEKRIERTGRCGENCRREGFCNQT